jgi:hypothetical protein
MAQGFFTIEQWKAGRGKGKGAWTAIFHLDADESVTKALAALEARGKPGLYRVLQMQRCIWAETEGGKLRLHGSHNNSAEGLARLIALYEREGGRRPVEKAKADRAAQKARRA